LSKRDETIVLWLIAFNALMLLIAPIGGATLVDALISFVRR